MEKIYKSLDKKLKEKFKQIKFFVLDFDGVFTDNTVYHSDDGRETVLRSKYDSIGFNLLHDAGLIDQKTDKNTEFKIMILSRETNAVVASVAKKLHLQCTQSTYEKPEALQEEIGRYGYKKEEVLYIGNDLNDLPCFDLVGLSVSTADADPRVKAQADYVTTYPGGKGAIREACELLLLAKDLHPQKK